MAPTFKATVETAHQDFDGSWYRLRRDITLGGAETLEQAEAHAWRWLRAVGADIRKAAVSNVRAA